MFEREYRDLAHVPRWAIMPTTRTQSVAEHSYYVSLYANQIAHYMWEEGYISEIDVIMISSYALGHDRNECFMSDIPGPVKRGSKMNKEYEHEQEKRYFDRPLEKSEICEIVIKIADLMDEYAFWMDQMFMGNRRSEVILDKIQLRLDLAVDNLPTPEFHKLNIKNKFLKQNVKLWKILPEDDNSDVVAS